MSLSTVLLAIVLILWGLSLTGVFAVPSVVLGVLAIVTGLLFLFERYVPHGNR